MLRAKQYTYFSFPVATTQFPLYFKLAVTAAATLNTSLPQAIVPNATYNASTYLFPAQLTPYYFDAGAGPLQNMPARPLLVAAFAAHGIPTANSLQFTSIPFDAAGLTLGITFSPGADGAFTQSGTMLAAALVSVDSFVTVNLTRDGCALLNCSNGGVCLNGQCQVSFWSRVLVHAQPHAVAPLQCARFPEISNPTQTYGWAGLTCDTLDCPGSPSCLGRGTCAIAAAGDPLHTTGRPYCACSAAYAGETCDTYNLTSAAVLGVLLGSSAR